MTATAIQHSPCLPKMPAHWLRVPECRDNYPSSPTSVGRTPAIEGIAQRTHCFVLFGLVDSDVSDLGSQWMNPTPRPRLHVRPCAPLGIPMNTTCGILCWDFSVMGKLAFLWNRTLMKMCWRGSHSPVTSHLIYNVKSHSADLVEQQLDSGGAEQARDSDLLNTSAVSTQDHACTHSTSRAVASRAVEDVFKWRSVISRGYATKVSCSRHCTKLQLGR